MEANILDVIHHFSSALDAQAAIAFGDQILEPLPVENVIAEAHLRREHLVEEDSTDGGLHQLATGSGIAHHDLGLELNQAHVVG